MTELTLTRTLPADPETVFAFVTRQENLVKWWGTEGMTIPQFQLDFTAPGPWSSVMENKDGGQFKVTGQVLSINPPNSVTFTWGWHDDKDQRGHESTVTFTVADNGKGGSLFTLHHANLSDQESADNHNSGWSSSLNKLDSLAA